MAPLRVLRRRTEYLPCVAVLTSVLPRLLPPLLTTLVPSFPQLSEPAPGTQGSNQVQLLGSHLLALGAEIGPHLEEVSNSVDEGFLADRPYDLPSGNTLAFAGETLEKLKFYVPCSSSQLFSFSRGNQSMLVPCSPTSSRRTREEMT